jgi:hypothetical protein
MKKRRSAPLNPNAVENTGFGLIWKACMKARKHCLPWEKEKGGHDGFSDSGFPRILKKH